LQRGSKQTSGILPQTCRKVRWGRLADTCSCVVNRNSDEGTSHTTSARQITLKVKKYALPDLQRMGKGTASKLPKTLNRSSTGEEDNMAKHERLLITTHKCTDSGKKLRLHGLLFRETASDEDGIIGNFMRNFMGKTCQSCSSTDKGRGIKRCSHSVFVCFWFQLVNDQSEERLKRLFRKQSCPSKRHEVDV